MAPKDTHQQQRRARQLEYFRSHPDQEIRTGRLRELNAAWGYGPKRSTAKGDLKAHEKRGHLTAHGPVERRRYRLAKAGVR